MVTIYSCNSLLLVKIVLLCCFAFLKINLVSDTRLICASLSDLKVLSVHFPFKLAVHSLLLFYSLIFHELLMELVLSFHLCWCSHLLVILLVYFIPSQVTHIFCLYYFAAQCMLPWAVLHRFTLCLLTFLLSHSKYSFNSHQVWLLSALQQHKSLSVKFRGTTAVLLPIVTKVISVTSL